MTEKKDGPEIIAALRRRAEERAGREAGLPPLDLEKLSSEEIRMTIQELHVHQIELEMQNEELRRTQEELDAARARYFDLYDLAPVGYFTLSPEGLLLETNLTAATMLGLDRSDLSNQPITRFIFREDQDTYYLHRKQFFDRGELLELELRMVRKDGTVFWTHLSATAAPNMAPASGETFGDATISRVVLSDITERKQAEETRAMLEAQLRQAQKLETLGVLAGGVAHDFNNLLAAIVGNANLGSMMAEPGTKMAHYFESIEKVALRAADLTRQLLAYAGKGKRLETEVDLDIVVKEIGQFQSVSIPRNVTLRYELADRLPFVTGDPAQLFQVLLNLITNASEAIGEGVEGEIVVRTRAENLDEGDIGSGYWPIPLKPGRYVTVEVADTGIGMAPEILALAFDPFFSTKFTGRGLGLAAVIGILGSHEGAIRVVSEVGKGTSIKVFLPAMQGARPASTALAMPSWRGEGRILVVDDEKDVRDVARQMAERLGFTVVEAWAGPEAVELFRTQHRDLTLVLLDLTMPRMNGWEVFRELQMIDKRVPVILSSGYDVLETSLLSEGLAGVLKKPYRMAEFQGVMQRTLDRRSSSVN